MKKEITPKTTDDLNNDNANFPDEEMDEFDRLLQKFVEDGSFNIEYSGKCEEEPETQDEPEDEIGQLKSYLPSQGKFVTRKLQGHTFKMPVRQSTPYYEGISVSLNVNTRDIIDEDYNITFEDLADALVVLHIDLSDYEEDCVEDYDKDYSKPLGLYLYHQDSPMPIDSNIVVPDNASIDWVIKFPASLIGQFYVVVENVDLKFVNKKVRQYGSYSIIPFVGLKKGDTKTSVKLLSIKQMGAIKDMYSDLTLKVAFQTKYPELVRMTAACWDADSLRQVASCSYPAPGQFLFHLENRGCWLDGNYIIWLYANENPIYKVGMTISGSKAEFTAIESLKKNPKERAFAMLASPSHYMEQNRHLICSASGNLPFKEWAAFMYQKNRILEHRSEKLLMKSLKELPVHVIYGAPTSENKWLVGCMAELLKDGNVPAVVDCSRLRTGHEQNMGYDNDKIDISSAVSDYNGALLINVGVFAQSEMAHQAVALRKKVTSMSTGNRIFILAPKGEVDQMLEFLPWLKDYILPENCVELTPPSRRDVMRDILSALNAMDLKCDQSVVRAISAATEAMPTTIGWDKEKIQEWVASQIVPRFIKRICQQAESQGDVSALSKRQMKNVILADINLNAFTQSSAGFDQCMEELNSLVGLSELKGSISDMFKQASFHEERRKFGLACGNQSRYHCIFTGNPGTGKTTVAKLMGKAFKSLGIVSKGGVIVADRKRLIGQYIGETEYNMRMLLKEAAGNVLFVDEAYTLVGDPNDKKDFGPKALEALLTILSQPNPDMVIVFAGYEKEMQNLFAINPGLDSRFPLKFKFPDYTVDELLQIGHNSLSKKGYALTAEADTELAKTVETIVAAKSRSFGNARWVEDFISLGIEMAMASRLAAAPCLNREAFITIQPQDIKDGYRRICPPQEPKRSLGFK